MENSDYLAFAWSDEKENELNEMISECQEMGELIEAAYKERFALLKQLMEDAAMLDEPIVFSTVQDLYDTDEEDDELSV